MADNFGDGEGDIVLPLYVDTSKASFDEAYASIDRLEEKTNKFKKQIQAEEDAVKNSEKEHARRIQTLRLEVQQSEKLVQVGRAMTLVGGAIIGAATASALSFVSKASAADTVAIKWRASLYDIEIANRNVGRVIANELNPALSIAAQKMTEVSKAIEANPDILKGIVGVGGALVALGTMVTVVNTVERTVKAMQALQMAMSAAQGVGIGSGGATLGTIGASMAAAAPYVLPALLAAGTVAGIIALVASEKKYDPKTVNPLNMNPFTGPNPLNTNPLTGKPLGTGGKVYGPPAPAPGITGKTYGPPAMSPADLEIYRQRLQVEQQADKLRLDGVKQFEDKRMQIEKDKRQLTRQYQIAESQALQDFLNSKKSIEDDYNKTESRNREDHQKALKRIDEESAARQQSLANDRDALGLKLEQQAAAKAKKDENDNYATEKKRRQQDYNDRLREMDNQFKLEQARRLQEYNYNMAMKTAEVQAAYDAYQAILNAAAKMISALGGILNSDGTTSPAPAATAKQRDSDWKQNGTKSSGASSSGNSSASVSISGSGLTVSQVQNIANQAAEKMTVSLMRKALVR